MNQTKQISEVAILVSLAVVLEVVFTGLSAFMPWMQLPYGGRISLSMLPLFIIAYRHGFKYGALGGMVYGVLNLLLDGVLWSPWSLPLDYLLAFGSIGLGAFGKTLFGANIKGFIAVVFIGSFFRYLFHVLSGAWLFGAYAGDYGFENIYVYSLVYNAYYLWLSALLCGVVGIFLIKRLNQEQDLF